MIDVNLFNQFKINNMKYLTKLRFVLILSTVISCCHPARLFVDGPCQTHHLERTSDSTYMVFLSKMDTFKVIYDGDDEIDPAGELIKIKVELINDSHVESPSRILETHQEFECDYATYWPSLSVVGRQELRGIGPFTDSETLPLSIDDEDLVSVNRWHSENRNLFLKVLAKPNDIIKIRITTVEEDGWLDNDDITSYTLTMRMPSELPSAYTRNCEDEYTFGLNILPSGYIGFEGFRNVRGRESSVGDRGAFIQPWSGKICIKKWPHDPE